LNAPVINIAWVLDDADEDIAQVTVCKLRIGVGLGKSKKRQKLP
jgi:hypothetical protein